MTGLEGRETEAGQPREAHWRSWTLHAKPSEPVVILVPLLTHSSKAKAQLTHKFWLLYANLRLLHSSVATVEHSCCRKPYTQKDNHLRLAGLTPQRARNSKTVNVWEEDLVSIQDIRVMILQWPALLSRQSTAGLDQMGLFRVWFWFLLMEIIPPGCLKCMDHCGG